MAGCEPSSSAPVTSRYKIAMRTATPLVTCSRTQDCGPSATSGVISMPRFIGPGCKTMASGLHAEHNDDVRSFECFFNSVDAANGSAWSDFFKFTRHPHGRAAKSETATKFSEQMNIGPCHTAVLKVAKNGNVQIVDGSFAVADGQSVQQTLRRMFMGAIPRVDYGNVEMARDIIGCAGGGMAHDQAVGFHCI